MTAPARVRWVALAAAAAGVLLAPFSWTAGRDETYAIVGARVMPVSGPVLENGTVVMRGGLIESVGATVVVPSGARVLEGRGLTLTPGLIDGFGGMGLPAASPRPSPAAGAREAAAPAGLAPERLALERVRVADALKARDDGVTTVLVVPPEGVLPGRSVLLNLSGDDAQGMVLRQPAALHVHMATLSGRYPNSLMGTMALVRQALLDAVRYREEWAAYEKSPAGRRRPVYDASLEAWGEVTAGRLPLVVTASRENDLRRALALADEFKVRVIVAGAPHAARLADQVKARKLPLLVSVNFDPPRAVSAFAAPDEEKERKDIEEAERNPAALHAAGVPFALVSGHAPSFLAGIRTAIARGLPPEAALRAVTLGAAEVLGIADRTGSLEPGKIANVVAWSGDPLAREAKVEMVFADGALHEPDRRPPPTPAPSEAER
ncbi:MAG TPA: amidohydrolase family protein [Vicinamibacteria bacterium]|nr:amidohydrolase family protein [Vicinamibacteria bacterium]